MFVKLVVVVLALLAIGAVATRQSSGRGRGERYVVQPHDTLWSIAVRRYGGDPREGVWRLRERNGLEDALIKPGQVLVLP